MHTRFLGFFHCKLERSWDNFDASRLSTVFVYTKAFQVHKFIPLGAFILCQAITVQSAFRTHFTLNIFFQYVTTMKDFANTVQYKLENIRLKEHLRKPFLGANNGKVVAKHTTREINIISYDIFVYFIYL